MKKGCFLVYISCACKDYSLGSQFKTSALESGQKWVSASWSPGREIMMSSIRSPFPCIFCSGVSNCCCGSQRMILVLSNQVEIMAKSFGQERRNPILDDWTPVLEFHTEHCSEVYSLPAGRDLPIPLTLPGAFESHLPNPTPTLRCHPHIQLDSDMPILTGFLGPGHNVSLSRPGESVSLSRLGEKATLSCPGDNTTLSRPGDVVGLS